MSFRVGQKVVCVRAGDSFGTSGRRDRSLVLGRVYEVLGVKRGCHTETMLLVEGGGNTTCHACGCDTGGHWKNALRFRPVQEDLTASLASSWTESVPSEQEVINVPQPERA